MSIRFAAPPQATRVRLSGSRARAAMTSPSNDNQGSENGDMLRASLRHFAEHGLAAAAHARAKAEECWFDGDREGYDWWLGICRTLDRRMARELAEATSKEA